MLRTESVLSDGIEKRESSADDAEAEPGPEPTPLDAAGEGEEEVAAVTGASTSVVMCAAVVVVALRVCSAVWRRRVELLSSRPTCVGGDAVAVCCACVQVHSAAPQPDTDGARVSSSPPPGAAVGRARRPSHVTT